ncbi:unnamed protein product, partial [Tetraodon nigroviridis]
AQPPRTGRWSGANRPRSPSGPPGPFPQP